MLECQNQLLFCVTHFFNLVFQSASSVFRTFWYVLRIKKKMRGLTKPSCPSLSLILKRLRWRLYCWQKKTLTSMELRVTSCSLYVTTRKSHHFRMLFHGFMVFNFNFMTFDNIFPSYAWNQNLSQRVIYQ